MCSSFYPFNFLNCTYFSLEEEQVRHIVHLPICKNSYSYLNSVNCEDLCCWARWLGKVTGINHNPKVAVAHCDSAVQLSKFSHNFQFQTILDNGDLNFITEILWGK